MPLPPVSQLQAWHAFQSAKESGQIVKVLEILGKGSVVVSPDGTVIGSTIDIWDVFHENAAPQVVTDRDLDRKGNVVAFGPVAQEYSEIEALLIVLFFAKSMKTSQGQKDLKDIIITYLNNAGKAISAMQEASCSHVYTALMNQYTLTNIYARLGLITPYDQLQTKTFLDHYFGELLKKDYVLQGVTTLVKTAIETTGSAYEAKRGAEAGEIAALAKAMIKE